MNCKFVSEVSSNHQGSLARCLEFVETSARIGCQAVKFQLFRIDELFAPEILASSEDHRRRKQWELPVGFIPEISARCKNNGIEFSCTPFYLAAVGELFDHVAFYKIASYELLWSELLIECSKTGKPVVLSTGMATLAEVDRAFGLLTKSGCKDITLLHCVSGYPTPLADCNLSVIGMMKDRFGCKVGWSDHTADARVIRRAVETWGVDMVEFHLDIDGSGDEYKIGHCWLPSDAEKIINPDRVSKLIDGLPVKRPSPSEMSDVEWRADPSDGLRPMISKRREWVSGNHEVAVKAFR